jgi:hypothetical protein
MGGHEKCLLLMTRGGGVKKFPKPAYVIHGCSLKETIDLKVTRAHSQLEHYFFSYLLTWEVDHWNSRDYGSNVAICHFLKPETNKGDFRLYFLLVKKSCRGRHHSEILKTNTKTLIYSIWIRPQGSLGCQKVR